MYYKSILQILKDPSSNENMRLKIIDETINDDKHMCHLYLQPDDKYKCPICNSNETTLFGKKSRTFIDECYANHKTYVVITYHRIKCKQCGKMFMDTIKELLSKQSISLNLKLNILLDLKDDVTFTYIAKKRNVSIQTVIDIFESFIDMERIPFSDVLCLDEFKNLKHSFGKFAFVMYDPINQKIYDILEDRKQDLIDNYLYKIPLNERQKVKYVVTDMNNSYRTIIKRHFSNATHVIDSFHYLRYIEDAFNNVRIRIQSTFKQNTPQYKILKRYWRILSSFQMTLDEKSLYNHIQKKKTDINTIIQDSLAISKELDNAYTLCQHFLYGCKNTKFENAKQWLDSWLNEIKESGISEFLNLIKLFKNWEIEILNSFIRFGDRRLHNGYLEGLNNRIKVIKRISYGYTNFTHFRNRLMYSINAIEELPIKSVNRNNIFRKKRK